LKIENSVVHPYCEVGVSSSTTDVPEFLQSAFGRASERPATDAGMDSTCKGTNEVVDRGPRCATWPLDDTRVEELLNGPRTPHTFAALPECPWPGHKTSIALIHVAKAAGKTLGLLLRKVGVNYTHIHVHSARLATSCAFSHYIVTTRDPLDRTISAFNFRHTRGGAPEYDKPNTPVRPSPAELQLYEDCFPELPGGVARFADAMAGHGECANLARACLHDSGMYCNHLSKGHSYFLVQNGLLSLLRRPDKHAYVVRAEHLEEDINGLLDWLCVPADARHVTLPHAHTGYPREADTNVSALGRRNLRENLAHEHYAKDAVEQLADSARPQSEWGVPRALAPNQETADSLCPRCDCEPAFDV